MIQEGKTMKDERYKYTFSSNLDTLMRSKKITIAMLAERTGIAPNTIAGYRSARVQPTAPQIIKIAEALKVMPNDLLRKANPYSTEKEIGDAIIKNINKALKEFNMTFKKDLIEEEQKDECKRFSSKHY